MSAAVIEYQYRLDGKRYAEKIASDETLSAKERKDAGRLVDSYGRALLRMGTGLLNDFNHRRATRH